MANMVYRNVGNTGVRLSPLGFGMMRLPKDEDVAIKMVREAINEGINYIDTAYGYLDGKSEGITGRALADGYRDKVYLATKMPVWLVKKEQDFDTILKEQLKRLQTDQIDFYLLHALDQKKWEIVKEFNLIEKMKEAREAGKIGYIGFSFHDTIDLFKEIVDSFDGWDFCQIQLNYMDTEYQAGIEGLKYASDKGLGVIIMEPLRGGFLAEVPGNVKEEFASCKEASDRSVIEWALDFLWDMPEVGTVLSGMSTPEQAMQNVEYAKRSNVGMLSESEHKTIKKVQDLFRKYNTVPCTGCSYCMPCPQGVAIPQSFAAYNEAFRDKNYEKAKRQYDTWTVCFGRQADACVGCCECESKCPQGIKISEMLKKVDNFF